jgi:hypothetical protein
MISLKQPQDGMCRFEGELWVAVLRLQFESGPVRLFTPDIGISTGPDERSRDKWRVFRSCTDFEKPQERAALAAALVRHAQHLGSLDRNAFSRDAAGYLELECAGRVVEIQGEGTAVRLAAVTQSERFTEVDGSHEVSARVVRPHAVRELVSPVRSVLPHPQADAPPSRIDIRVVNLGPPGIPELVRLLDGLTANRELDVPKANHGFAGGVSGRH